MWETFYRAAHHSTPVPTAPRIGGFFDEASGRAFVASFGAEEDLFVELAQPDLVRWWRHLLHVLAQRTRGDADVWSFRDGLRPGLDVHIALGPRSGCLVSGAESWRRLLMLTPDEVRQLAGSARDLEKLSQEAHVADLRRVCSAEQRAALRADLEKTIRRSRTRCEYLERQAPDLVEGEREQLRRLERFVTSLS
jgi:hypothetical protein